MDPPIPPGPPDDSIPPPPPPPMPPRSSGGGAGVNRIPWIVAAVVVAFLLGGVAVAAGRGGDGDSAVDRTEQDDRDGTDADSRAADSTAAGSVDDADEQRRGEEKTGERTGAPDPGDPQDHGDDATLDALWDACATGDHRACDELFLESGFGTEYEKFGETCGGRNEPAGYCEAVYANGGPDDPAVPGNQDPVEAIDSSSEAYGDDPGLDALWDGCEKGAFDACDELYVNSPFGSAYEEFGETCGHRNEPQGYCKERYG